MTKEQIRRSIEQLQNRSGYDVRRPVIISCMSEDMPAPAGAVVYPTVADAIQALQDDWGITPDPAIVDDICSGVIGGWWFNNPGPVGPVPVDVDDGDPEE